MLAKECPSPLDNNFSCVCLVLHLKNHYRTETLVISIQTSTL